MEFELVPHPNHHARYVNGVQVHVWGSRDTLMLRYLVSGSDALVLPPRVEQARTDELWQTTCFEIFVREPGSERYAEFNFSSSSCWAAYQFDSYRAGMTDRPMRYPPDIVRLSNGVEVDCDAVGLPPAGELRVALSAVIEEADGIKSYWALAHPPEGPPDFHHPACFAATLPPPARS